MANHNSPLSTMNKPQGLGSASMTLLERDIKLFDGYGRGMFFANPKTPAQEYVNQGYAALNVFHYADAYRSFRMATKKDENEVQGYIGLVFSIADQDSSPAAKKLMVDIFNHVEMIRMKTPLSKTEDAWLDYAKSVYVQKVGGATEGMTNPVVKTLNESYQQLATTDGENVEFKAYVSWSIFSGATAQFVKQMQKSVLADHPDHAGANHYLLHIAEMENDMPTAKSFGEALAPLALKSAHAQHMLGHTLPQFGLWQEALDMFLIADQIHHDWAKENQAALHEDWHYAHNLDLMAATYLGLGDSAKAFDNWNVAMEFDFRATPKAIGVLLADNRLLDADDLISKLEQNGPQWVNFLAPFRYELNILMGQTEVALKPQMPRKGTYAYFVEALRKVKLNQFVEDQLVAETTAYFTARLTSGGFDGWSNSFVELLRLQTLAAKLDLQNVVASLEVIVTKSKAGTL
jgi:tetratricopeptide (TPR) repeat protein